MNPKLSVIIPAYNETNNLKKGVLKEVSDYLKNQDYSYEVLVVDDGSTDNTRDLVKEQIKSLTNFALIENPHGGKAHTVITGMLKGKGEIVMFTDMDQATPLNQAEKFFPLFESGSDVVIGSRHGRKGAPPLRRLSAWGFATLRNIILGLPFSDTQCGFKAFTNRAVQEVFPKMLEIWRSKQSKGSAVNAGFDVETLFIAKKANLEISEVPVEWRYVDTERVQFVKDALEAIKDMLRIRRNDFNGKYN